MKTLIIAFLFVGVCHQTWAERFTEIAGRNTGELVSKILDHKFIIELADGKLSDRRSTYFKAVDGIYVAKFIKVLRDLSFKLEEYNVPELQGFLRNLSSTSTSGSNESEPGLERCPACEAYSEFEAQAVNRDPFEGVAAISPCFIVYAVVAKSLRERSVGDNKYQSWIDRYSSPKYLEWHKKMVDYLNQLADKANQDQFNRMLEVYRTAVEYEFRFFDSAYQLGQ